MLKEWREEFGTWILEVYNRLEAGEREYGNDDRPIEKLRTELEQEFFDVAGWSFMLWLKTKKLPGPTER